MGKLLLISICVATIAIPSLCAREPNPRRGIKRMLLWMLVFNALYLGYLLRFYVPENLTASAAAFAEAGFGARALP